jgi:plastocyanin
MKRIALGAAVIVAAAVAAAVALGGRDASTTTVTVVAGKPSEFGFTLTPATVARGTTVFEVVNRGKLRHNFSIVGKRTPVLLPGKKASVSVTFRKAGTFTYSSTVAGQAAAGMKGGFVVTASKAKAAAATVTPKTGSGAASSAGTVPESGVGGACASASATHVSVKIFEFGFTLSPATIPCGTVTFDIANTGMIAHTFDVQSPNAAGIAAFNGGKVLLAGESATQTLSYGRVGNYQYQCDTHFAEFQMGGSFRVVNG